MDQYILFELPKVQLLAKNHKNVEIFKAQLYEIVEDCIKQLAKKQNFTESNMIKQIVYRFHKEKLPDWIIEIVGDITTDYDGGFIHDTFEPDEDYLNDILATIIHSGQYDEVKEWYKIHQALATLGIYKNTDDAVEYILSLEESTLGKNVPLVKVDVEVLQKFFHNKLKPIELLMVMAISSIGGRRNHTETNKNFIRCRMLGARDIKEHKKLIKNPDLRSFATYISGRRRFDNTLTKLRRSKIVKGYYVNRGKYATMLISFTLNDLELKRIVEAKLNYHPEGTH